MTDALPAPMEDAESVPAMSVPDDAALLGRAVRELEPHEVTRPDADVSTPRRFDEAPRALAPRVQTWWRIGFALNAVVPSILLGAVSWFGAFERSVPHVVAAAGAPWLVAGLLALRIPARRYAAWRYRVTPDALRLDRGVMFRVESVVPYTRIQHVDTEQGPLERLLGLSHVTVHTASGSGSNLTIPGLTPEDGHALREHLAMLAGVVEPL